MTEIMPKVCKNLFSTLLAHSTVVSQVSSSVRNIGCRRVTIRDKPVHIYRFSEQVDSSYRDEHIDSLHVDVNLVECKVKALGGNKR